MIVQNKNPKVPTFLNLRHSIRSNAQEFARLDYKSFSRLVEVALLEYMNRHQADIKNPVTLNVQNVMETPRIVKVPLALCEIGHCKNKQSGSIGTFKGKSYKLCVDHSNKLASAKGWRVT